MKSAYAFLALCILAAASGFAAEKTAAKGGPHSLRMEELEVRGLREKPGVLYLPVHHGITTPSPVRYDLFLTDMARPVLPREISTETSPAGIITDQGDSID
ncbi:MAG: hypothetical protein E4G97_02970 [Deltaproteobacteria bacterium]|jgi:hypothetical protein|nr:MAG: hypothetical protein E4G97_02970 [Deltaproteobacteria bacterium]